MRAGPSVAVVGATGYSGLEAVRLLRAHPHFRLGPVFASGASPERDLGEIDQGLAGAGISARPVAPDLLSDPPEAALLALPDDASSALAPALLAAGTRVVDLSAAFRLDGVYGLAEWAREAIEPAALVANPGCYPTATLLALLPLSRAGLLDPDEPIVVDAKSGVTGAGRKVEASYLFAEVNESLRPYRALDHRHVPEIARGLGRRETGIWFVPHLLPISRGLMATCYVRLRGAAPDPKRSVEGAFREAYEGAPFVRLLGEGRWPELRGVVRTNLCTIGWLVDPIRGGAVVVAAIDNLVKGAAGQAVQNLNLMFGRPEAEGLPA